MVNKQLIKVGFCIAYDWYLLRYSLPLIYEDADMICLSVDKDRISWSGNPFSWDEPGFRQLVRELDPLHKIQVLEEDYHLPELQPMENEVRQRNKIAAAMGEGGWHIQLDTDEFFINFKGFAQYLKQLKPRRQLNVVCPWITLYKQNDEGFFYVKPARFDQVEFMQIATLWPRYEYGRRNGYFNIHCDFAILHLSWARPEQEIWEKLNNWGHRNDFDIAEYFTKWKDLNAENYREYRDFHHVVANTWPALGFIPAKNVAELMVKAKQTELLPVSPRQISRKNSIWLSRLRKLFRIS